MNMQPVTLWMLGAFFGGVLLHVDRLPWLFVTVAVIATGWRALAELRGETRLPASWLRGGFALSLLAGVLLNYRTLNGLGPGTALLVSMGSVKLMETRSSRDRYIMIGVALFLMLAACLDRQSMLRAPFYLALTWACCVALIFVANPTAKMTHSAALRLSGRALLMSAPLALLLFVFFPRLPGQLWALPNQGSGTTGLSDTMTPGGISALSESDEPAFRVRFDGAAPPPQQRYWRGPVLHTFDGYSWKRERSQSYRPTTLSYSGPAYSYRLTLEPHQRNWIFALEMPAAPLAPNTFLTHDLQLIAAQPVTQITSYQLVSRPASRASNELSLLGRRTETALPADRNPRSNALARKLRANTADTPAFIGAVLDYFRAGGFTYTLTPELLEKDSVDDFIFNTRAGFCGHYASAFVSMMRAADVPARVVTGYQGGEWNPLGDFFIIRQSDAHAWAEVWIDNEGWRRVDPTAVVSPERLSRGLLDILPDAGTQASRFARDLRWVMGLRQSWDAANAWWNDNIADFNARAQLEILGRLGFDSPRLRQLGYIAAGGLALWVLITVLWLARHSMGANPDPLTRGFRRLCALAARRGWQREPHEAPLSYVARLRSAAPALATQIAPLLEEYAELRYGPLPDVERIRRIRAWSDEIRRLRIAA